MQECVCLTVLLFLFCLFLFCLSFFCCSAGNCAIVKPSEVAVACEQLFRTRLSSYLPEVRPGRVLHLVQSYLSFSPVLFVI